MDTEDAVAAYAKLPSEQQLRFLAAYAHWVTIAGRGTYESGTRNVLNPGRLRELNEVQHRIVAHLGRLLDQDERRYPDDVLVHIITGEGDPELLELFRRALMDQVEGC